MADGVLSLNDRALVVADELARRADELGASVRHVGLARIIDVGVETVGSLDAGVLVARACLADLASVRLGETMVGDIALPSVIVSVPHPVAACMASQYAGWQITEGKYFAMGSGPMRAAYGKEVLYDDIGFREKPTAIVGILETVTLPDKAIVEKLVAACHVPERYVTLIAARTASLAGGVQIAARSVETALHKLHELKFDLKRIVGGFGSAPVPPVAADDLRAIGRTNDAVLYGARISLYVTGDDETLADVVQHLPSSASADHGRPFGEIFKRYDHDFYKIDPLLFSPAAVTLQNLDTGRVHHAGKVNHAVLTESFFGGADA